MVFQLFLIVLGFLLLLTILKIASYATITKKNLELIQDIILKLNPNLRTKLDDIIHWHTKYGYPIYIERSIKYTVLCNSYNKDRFTIVIPLSYFFTNSNADIDESKWLEWTKVLEIPEEIDRKSIDYLACGRGDVDFIWGIDLLARKEKIYLEDEEKKIIQGYIYRNKKILERYKYYRKDINNHERFSFMYLRTNVGLNQIDSYHVALRNPIEVKINNKKYLIHIISFQKNKSYTFYYRNY